MSDRNEPLWECWYNLSNLTNQRVYQELVYRNGSFKEMITGSVDPPLPSFVPFYFCLRAFSIQRTRLSRSLQQASLDRAKLGVFLNFKILFIVFIVILILLQPTFWKISIYSQLLVKIYSDQTRIKSLLKWLKNIGMASEKLLYRNTLNTWVMSWWEDYVVTTSDWLKVGSDDDFVVLVIVNHRTN